MPSPEATGAQPVLCWYVALCREKGFPDRVRKVPDTIVVHVVREADLERELLAAVGGLPMPHWALSRKPVLTQYRPRCWPERLP